MKIIVVQHKDDLQDIKESFEGNRIVEPKNIMLLTEAKEKKLVPELYKFNSIYGILDTKDFETAETDINPPNFYEEGFLPNISAKVVNNPYIKQFTDSKFKENTTKEIIENTLYIKIPDVIGDDADGRKEKIIRSYKISVLHKFLHQQHSEFCIYDLIQGIILKHQSLSEVNSFTDSMISEAEGFLKTNIGYGIEKSLYPDRKSVV